VHPAGQGIAGQREQEPAAAGAEAGDELVSYWSITGTSG